MAWQSR